MNQTTLHTEISTYHISEPRQNQRYGSLYLFAVTDRGTGKITNISESGMAFGCLYPHTFGDTLHLDILDAFGTLIKQVTARKIWEKRSQAQDFYSEFEFEIGVEFVNLTGFQQNQIRQLLKHVPAAGCSIF